MKAISPARFEKLALKHGWVFRGGNGGSHRVYEKAGVVYCLTIPFHPGDLPTGLQLKLMKQAGISREEL